MLKKLLNRFRPPVPAAEPAGDIAAADAAIDQGNALEDAGQLAPAEAAYRRAVALAPRHPRAHLNLGIVLAAEGDQDGAAAAFERVLALDAHHPFGNYNYARLLVLRGDTARARALVDEALRVKPQFAQALELRVRIERDEGFVDAALAGCARSSRAIRPTGCTARSS